jgi:putative iron-dependent peroxidase
MARPQPGIFAQGTRSHYHLEFDIGPDASDDAIAAALGGLREPAVTAGGSNIVVGFGPDLWRRLRPDDAPDALVPFTEVGAGEVRAPATQHDLWVWTHGTGEDVELDVARGVVGALLPVATLAAEQPCFVYKDSRDLSGFIDGTENPPVEEAFDVALVPDGQVGEGGAFVITQRWVHDLESLHERAVAAQEAVFGRTKADSVELDDKPVTAHISRVVIEDDGGELEIYRRSTPYGRVGELGLYFVAFSADPSRFRRMLARMFGTDDEVMDALTTFSRPVSGSNYFAPSLDALDGLLPGD